MSEESKNFEFLLVHLILNFLFFHVGNTSFFIFNFADAFISIGAALFFLTEFKKFLQNRSR